MKNIPLFETIVTPKAKELINKILDSGFLNQGPMVEEFEKQLELQLGLKNPVTVNSCTSSLFLALKLAGIKEGDRVGLPPQTFIATGLAIKMLGAIPCFLDIDKNGNLHPDLIIKFRPKSIICVHWGGVPCDLEPIYEWCQTYDIKLIEDAAHALGSWYKDSYIGDCKYSDYCCFSLQAIKSLTTGDGGILCCKNDEDRKRAEKMRWFGIDKKNIIRNENGERVFDVDQIGFKFHMNDIQASMGLGNLDGFLSRIQYKRMLAQIYNWRLDKIDGILNLPQTDYYSNPSYWLYTICVKNRDKLAKKLRENGVQCSTVDTRIDKYSIFGGINQYTFLPNQEWFEEHQLSIPCTSKMSLNDILYIIDLIKEGW